MIRFISYYVQQSILRNKEREKVVDALLSRVDSLMMATENFLKHESYSSKKEGFRVVVNGLLVHREKVITTNKAS